MIAKYEGVKLQFDQHVLLEDVCFEVNEGDFIYVMGEVGSGKTSLLRSMYGEMPLSEGQAEVMQTDMRKVKKSKLPQLRKQLGIVFQDFQLLNDRTVEANLDFVLCATGWKSKQERKNRIGEVLSQVGLEERASSMPYELSGGEQQRVCIARAVLNTPSLLLADEPTANLDVDNGRRVMRLLHEISEQGTAVIISTHNHHWMKEFEGQLWTCSDQHLNVELSTIVNEEN